MTSVNNPKGAHFDVKIDGVGRTYRDERGTAIVAARFLRDWRRQAAAQPASRSVSTGETICQPRHHADEARSVWRDYSPGRVYGHDTNARR